MNSTVRISEIAGPVGRIPAAGEASASCPRRGVGAEQKPDGVPAILSRVAGTELPSFTDFPGELSGVIFLQGCNLRCPWCHNPALIPRAPVDRYGDRASALRLGERIAGWKGLVSAVVISGGEATVHDDLGELISWCKALGFRTKLDTNGASPKALDRLIDNEETRPEIIAMDLKAPWDSVPRSFGMDAASDSTAFFSRVYGFGADLDCAAAGWAVLRARFSESVALLRAARRAGLVRVIFRTTVLPFFDAALMARIETAMEPDDVWIRQTYRKPDGLGSGSSDAIRESLPGVEADEIRFGKGPKTGYY